MNFKLGYEHFYESVSSSLLQDMYTETYFIEIANEIDAKFKKISRLLDSTNTDVSMGISSILIEFMLEDFKTRVDISEDVVYELLYNYVYKVLTLNNPTLENMITPKIISNIAEEIILKQNTRDYLIISKSSNGLIDILFSKHLKDSIEFITICNTILTTNFEKSYQYVIIDEDSKETKEVTKSQIPPNKPSLLEYALQFKYYNNKELREISFYDYKTQKLKELDSSDKLNDLLNTIHLTTKYTESGYTIVDIKSFKELLNLI